MDTLERCEDKDEIRMRMCFRDFPVNGEGAWWM